MSYFDYLKQPEAYLTGNVMNQNQCDDHDDFEERLRRTLYYGNKRPSTERPSLPVTEIATGFFQDATPRELGRVDMDVAANIGRRACVSPCALMLSMVYIERLRARRPDYLKQMSSSDLFLISMMVASKYLYDEGIDEEVFNDEWAESAALDLEDLNQLERDFLRAMDWNLFVNPEDFFEILERFEHRIAYGEGCARGSFTYTDLAVLCRTIDLRKFYSWLTMEITKVLAVCSVAYLGCAATILGSVLALSCVRTQLASPGLPPSMNGTLINPAYNHTTDDVTPVEPRLNTPILSLPGMVTLALLRDTVTDVVTAVNDNVWNSKHDGIVRRTTSEDTTSVNCNCGMCGHVRHFCWNESTTVSSGGTGSCTVHPGGGHLPCTDATDTCAVRCCCTEPQVFPRVDSYALLDNLQINFGTKSFA